MADDRSFRERQNREFSDEIARKERRKLRGIARRGHTIWHGLGLFGIVGWSVTVPTLIFTAVGLWIDATWPSRFSWTLMLMVFGLAIGSLNAWYWVQQERREIEKEREFPDEEEKGNA